MALAAYVFHRGQRIALADRVEEGTIEPGYSMRARMKPVQAHIRNLMPGDSVAAASPAFTSTFVPAAGGQPASWVHALTAAESRQIAAGEYLFDSSLLLDNEVIWTSEPVRLILRESASAG
ncbi:hypothetical protein DXH95_03175 [Sphingorhabdus pulchriflava]|uniref:Uncharacterized protein n=1 Tax=Sphingorhabdus pulchriflava TaxID=2292257 RepID=A0A371BGB2_9SPHN|nr:hypothetical protein [Sphingorhabdus pulchriflava]RDV06443.1 hypothetical protein DXH95_03175 [Sphingorhabdus pulchriflava]